MLLESGKQRKSGRTAPDIATALLSLNIHVAVAMLTARPRAVQLGRAKLEVIRETEEKVKIATKISELNSKQLNMDVERRVEMVRTECKDELGRRDAQISHVEAASDRAALLATASEKRVEELEEVLRSMCDDLRPQPTPHLHGQEPR